MNELISQIEETVSELLKYDLDSYAPLARKLVNDMIRIFPGIISIYSDPKMDDVKEDAMYWPAQLERIITALGNSDRFETVDVLYNETYPNLIELRDMLVERGLM